MAGVGPRPLRHGAGARRRRGDGHLRALLAGTLLDEHRTLAGDELRAAVDALAAQLAGERTLVVVEGRADLDTALSLLAGWAAGHAVLPVEDAAPFLERYDPRWVLRGGEVHERDAAPVALHPDLRLLLSTSGSTGSPKLVRLSERNVLANAASIGAYLELGPDERAIASLPLAYSYGLSVLTSHLLAGAAVAFTPHAIIRPEFWEAFRALRCTSFAGVPYAYAMLERIGVERMELPTLRYLTQAGGRLDPAVAARFAARRRLFVMYGQTEATARIAYVPPERLADKPGAIGVAIPGGALSVSADGELVYEGANVMLGYAETREDLARGDELGGVLATGDLGRVDDDGFHYVTGRSKRIAKVFGARLNLDEVEAAVEGPAAAVAGDDAITLYVEREVADVRALARSLALTSRTLRVVLVDALPVRASGKVDYAALEA